MGIAIQEKEDLKLSRLRDEAYIEALDNGRDIELCVRGMSMYPAIKDYDIATILPFANNKLAVGDIIFVVRNTEPGFSFLIHRLIRIDARSKPNRFYTKGDSLVKGREGPFERSQIKGKVVKIRRQNLEINLETKFNLMANRIYAVLSWRLPRLFKNFNFILSLILEGRLFFQKCAKRLRAKNPLCFNAQELVILLGESDFASDIQPKAVQLIREGLDWDEFAKHALASGRTVTVSERIKNLSKLIQIPLAVLDRLENARLKVIAQTTYNHRQLFNILKLFSQKQIDVLPLKGTLLSDFICSDISRRGINVDIDLLIRETDKTKASALLNNLGYQAEASSEIEAWRKHIEFLQRGCLAIELHWDITVMRKSAKRINSLWQDTKRLNIEWEAETVNYCWPDNEALLLYLCVVLVDSFGYRNLKYFFDIEALISRTINIFDWQDLIDKSKRFGVQTCVFASLLKAKQILGARVPGFALDRLKPNLVKQLLIDIFLNRSVIFNLNLRRRVLDELFGYFFFEFLEASSFRDLLKIIKRVLFPPRQCLELSGYIAPKPAARQVDIEYLLCLVKRLWRASYGVAKGLLTH